MVSSGMTSLEGRNEREDSGQTSGVGVETEREREKEGWKAG